MFCAYSSTVLSMLDVVCHHLLFT